MNKKENRENLILKGGKIFSKVFMLKSIKKTLLDHIFKIEKIKKKNYYLSTKMTLIDKSEEYPIWEGKFQVQINKNITLKLEDNITIIYVNGEKFSQCKFLLLDIPDIALGEEIDSIDKAEAKFSRALESKQGIISAEEEFWGHASNIQAWAENDYDSRILHRTIAFPLLKKLADLGDKRALLRFQEEIIKRINENYIPVTKYIIIQGYLTYIDEDQYNLIRDNRILTKEISDTERLTIFINPSDSRTFSRIETELINRFNNTNDAIEMNELIRLYLPYLTEKAYHNIKSLPLFKKIFELRNASIYTISNLINGSHPLPDYIKKHLSDLIYEISKSLDLSESKSFLAHNLHRILPEDEQFDIIMNTPNLKEAIFSSNFYLRKLWDIPDKRAKEVLQQYILSQIRNNEVFKIKELVLEGFLEYLTDEQLEEANKNKTVAKYIEAVGTWKKEFEIEENVKINIIREEYNGILYVETSGNRDYYIADNSEVAVQWAKERIKEDLESADASHLFEKNFLQRNLDKKKLISEMIDDFDKVVYDDWEAFFDKDEIIEIIEALDLKIEDDDLNSIWDDIFMYLEETPLYKERRKEYAEDKVENELEVYFGEDVYKNYLNIEKAVEEAINSDGWEHFVASYDGYSHELSNGKVYWRHN